MTQNTRSISQRLRWFGAICAVLSCTALGCSDDSDAFNPQGGNNFQVAGLGDMCEETRNCQRNLKCEENICVFAGDAEEGAQCQRTGECAPGLFCDALKSVCTKAGETAEGQGCTATAECEAGLICTPKGFSGVCAKAGETDINDTCNTTSDCLAGLNCAQTPGTEMPVCTSGPKGIPVPWVGTRCERTKTEDGPSRFYFEIPRGEVDEFYRLPFPNDLRLKNGKPDLSGHPTPGKGLLGFDIVQTYVDAIERDQEGFGLSQAILLRYTEDIDLEGLKTSGVLRLVDVNPQSPTYGQNHPISWSAVSGGASNGRYICQNWLAIRPFWGRPLTPGTTYALIITKGVKTKEGADIEPDADLAAMLGEARPTGDDVQAASWDTYDPLRRWVSETDDIIISNIAAATVFTTGDPWKIAKQLPDAVENANITTSDLTQCDAGVASPCTDGLENSKRNCGSANNAYDEIHGKISLPIFQKGQAPYLDDGGEIGLENGAPKIQRQEDVCMAMTVPKSDMPEAGWPVLIYAHGTNGRFNSHVNQVSERFSLLKGDNDENAGMVVIGWDQVQHFSRRGDSTLSPEPLVFNYGNPKAARGNFLQAAADIHAIAKFVRAFNVEAGQSPTGKAIKIDPTKIYYMGHSQGGTSGPIALPFSKDIKGAALSGAGAGLTLALLHKTQPVPALEGLKIALQDPDITASHPVLSLFQGYFEDVDPMNYAQYIGARQVENVTSPKHLFHLFGVGDTYTPPQGMKAFALASRGWYINPVFDEFQGGGIRLVDGAVTGNLTVEGTPYTVVGRQYEPDGYDGHFVTFRNEKAQQNLDEFMLTMILDATPTVSP